MDHAYQPSCICRKHPKLIVLFFPVVQCLGVGIQTCERTSRAILVKGNTAALGAVVYIYVTSLGSMRGHSVLVSITCFLVSVCYRGNLISQPLNLGVEILTLFIIISCVAQQLLYTLHLFETFRQVRGKL